MFLLHGGFDDDCRVGGVGVGVGGGSNFMLAVNSLCNVNVDDSFPLSHEANLQRFYCV